MDSVEKAKLLEQQHKIDELKTCMEEKMDAMRAEAKAVRSKAILPPPMRSSRAATLSSTPQGHKKNTNFIREKIDSDTMKARTGIGIADAFLISVIAYAMLSR